MKGFARFIIRRAGLIALLGNLLAIGGGYYSVQLYKNLRTDIEELLPRTARSVVDLEEVARRLEAIDNLSVLVFSEDTQASKRFIQDLAKKLEKAPEEILSSVEYQIQNELRFFRKRQALYIDLEDLKKIRNYIDQRIEYEKELYNPLNIFSEVEIPEPVIDLEGIRAKYATQTSTYERFPDGYYATPDETKRILLAYMPSNRSGLQGAKRLQEFVNQQIAELDPKSYASDLEIHFTGGVRNTIEEQAALVADLELSTIIVVVITLIAMLIFFKAARATFALLGSLLIGTFWTFGVAFFVVGYLNANSAFLGAIVIGNGINYGIMLLARYLEERRAHKPHDESLISAMVHSAAATSTASLAAGLAYGSLMLTSFRGFNQFGVIGLIGMVLCWIAAFTLLPAYLTLWHRWTPASFAKIARRKRHSFFANAMASFVNRAPGAVVAITLVATLSSAYAFFSERDTPLIETDLSKLRNKASIESGSVYYSRYSDEIFQRYLSPVVVMPRSFEETQEIARRLKEKKDSGEIPLIQQVQTVDEFVPKRQEEKIQVLDQIRKLLPPKIMRELPPKEREMVSEFLTPEAFQKLDLEDLPELMKSKFREKTGELGRLVLVYPPLGASKAGSDRLISMISELRETADSVSPGAPVAGAFPITADLISSIIRDGPKATLFAFLAVIVLVVVIFRQLKPITMVLLALILGVIWLGGIILGFDLKINFLNFIALPITFGIGVDYGVNIFQRYKEEGADSIVRVIRETGGAVGLCSLTTIVGYGSLLIAQNQAFVSFGLLAVLGEITCLFAAILSLPAILQLYSRFTDKHGGMRTRPTIGNVSPSMPKDIQPPVRPEL